jgi:hypothetical protein
VDLLTTAADEAPERIGIAAGDPVSAPEGATSVRLPDGTVRAHPGGPLFTETGTAGLYEFVAAESRPSTWFAVNATPPSAAGPLDREGVATRLSPAWEGTSGTEAWPDAVLSGRRGLEVWRPLAVLLLLVLLAEGWLAAYGGRGARAATRAKEKPPVTTPLAGSR